MGEAKYVRWRTMTYDEQEAKAKELGIESPTDILRKGYIRILMEGESDPFLVKEEFDEDPEPSKELMSKSEDQAQ